MLTKEQQKVKDLESKLFKAKQALIFRSPINDRTLGRYHCLSTGETGIVIDHEAVKSVWTLDTLKSVVKQLEKLDKGKS